MWSVQISSFIGVPLQYSIDAGAVVLDLWNCELNEASFLVSFLVHYCNRKTAQDIYHYPRLIALQLLPR